ncbi:hypothetical protein CANMA_000861 [Candida margitis]|uniref:uncharacterized protein n=1 Tax=Candida margitis TaxID=1775924 RepID=UPI0022273023|nr:uncharacterized protein CANMA_000861 [Candida margitis]KAI5970037.1 hypothetical protein CANMA_000861 [Candida margitis]
MDDQLKQFLFLLPSQCNFHYDNHVRKEIRRALFLSVTDNGRYLDRVFPELSNPSEELEKDLNWKLSEYSESINAGKYRHVEQGHFASHPNRTCSRVFRRGEPIIRCLTCAYDQSCALCSHCYRPLEHEGHEIVIQICIRENGGVCDCGDPEAWKASSQCAHASSDLEGSDKKLPKNFQLALVKTFGVILDFLIDISINCDMHFSSPQEVDFKTVQYNFASSTLDPHKYGICSNNLADGNNDKFYLQLYNDQVRHFRDAAQRVRLASQKSNEFAKMVTERVHNFGKAEVLASKDISLLLERQKILSATGLASSIRSERDVFREAMCQDMIVWLSEFTESEFFRSSITTEDLFAQAFCEKWRPGLINKQEARRNGNGRAGVLGDDFEIPKLTSENHRTLWVEEDAQQTEILCKHCGNRESVNASAVGSRLQYMMFLNLRLWKASRELMHVMYSTSLVTNAKYKHIMCSQYMEIYTGAADQFLSLDREPELNVMFSLSIQLFSNPRNSESIIKEGDFISVLSAVFVFLTSEKISESTLKNRRSREISIRSLRNRRWGQLFLDIGFIISRGKQFYDVSNDDISRAVCDLLGLFQGRPVMKREKNNHVEYENPDFSTFFNSASVIYKFADLSASTLNSWSSDVHIRQTKALGAIGYVISYLITLESHNIEGINYENTDIKSLAHRKTIAEPMTRIALKALNWDDDNVSFLHPLHSYVCSLIESAQFQDWDGLVEKFKEVGSRIGLPESFSVESLIFDYPIKTLVLMSQIKCGYWVRNGFTVKSQLHLYKNTGLREYGYMRDLFLIQIFSCICDPDFVGFMILDRWMLLGDWAYSKHESPYDAQTLPFILEECASFFIHLMTENSSLKGLSESDVGKIRIEKEIIHNLCFGPLNYKKLCSCISERVVLDKRFEIILNKMTNYTKPVGNNDSGMFELKEEYLEEVDPYYFNYSTNTRDEALTFVKERIHKVTGSPLSSIVIEPDSNVNDILDIYKYCGNVCTSVHFTKFVIKMLSFIWKQDFDKVESLMETTLHLIHVCSLESLIDTQKHVSFFTRFVSVASDYSPVSISVLLSRFLLDERYTKVHAKIRAIMCKLEQKYSCLESIINEQLVGCGLGHITISAPSEVSSEDEVSKKKKLAKLRQEKLLNKFKKQQDKFLKQNKDNAIECDDAEMEEDKSGSPWRLSDANCILCQNASLDLGPFGIIANIGKSSTFRNVPFENAYWFLKSFSDPANLNKNPRQCRESRSHGWNEFMANVKENNAFGPGFDSNDCVESKLTASSCGHGMHFKCYLNYLEGIRTRLNQITRNTFENPKVKEILCPLCKAVNNVFIPVFSSDHRESMEEFLSTQGSQHINKSPLDEDCIFNLIESASSNFTVSCSVEGQTWLSWLKTNHGGFNTSWNSILNSIAPITFPRSFESALPMILSNTIKSTEIALRGVDSGRTLVFDQIPSKSLITMKAMNELRLLMQVEEIDSIVRLTDDALAKVLAKIMSFSATGINEAIAEADFTDLLIEITPLNPLRLTFNQVLRVTFVGHVIQCLYVLIRGIRSNVVVNSWNYSIHDIPQLTDIEPSVVPEVIKCFNMLGGNDITALGRNIGQILYTMVVKSVTPFLRRAGIYAFIQCNNSEQSSPNIKYRGSLEADELCNFMNIPTISETFKYFSDLESWEGKLLHNFATIFIPKTNRVLLANRELEYPGIFKLIDLPDRLDDFFTQYYYSEKFSKPYQKIEDPAICLVCGTVVDLQNQAVGTVEGQCTAHYSRECSSEDGIFLLPKDRVILLLHKYKGSFHTAPYLDDSGELADDNKRARTLHLMQSRYDDFIRNVWLDHNIANYIARNLESVLDPGGWETL